MTTTKRIPFSKVKNFYADSAEYLPEDAVLTRKYIPDSQLQPMENADGKKVLWGVFSKPTIDWDGEVLLPEGAIFDFYRGNGIYNHKVESETVAPIFRVPVDKIVVDSTQIAGPMIFSDTYDWSITLFNLACEGIITGISLGFYIKETIERGQRGYNELCEKYNIDKTRCVRFISKFYVYEISLVPVACNPDAYVQSIISTKSIKHEEKLDKELGFDTEMINKLIETKEALNEAKAQVVTLSKMQTKALKPLLITKAVANPTKLDGGVFIDVLTKEEKDLAKALDETWQPAVDEMNGLDFKQPVDKLGPALDAVYQPTADMADKIINAKVDSVVDMAFSGYVPEKYKDQMETMKKEYADKLRLIMQPDPSKNVQFESYNTWKNDTLRKVVSGEAVTPFDMAESNATTANIGIFGGYNGTVEALAKEAVTGDIAIINGTDDEKLCGKCGKWIDQMVSISGTSSDFPSLETAKADKLFHPNCRCTLSIIEPQQKTKSVKPEIKPLQLKLITKSINEDLIIKRATLLARGKVV